MGTRAPTVCIFQPYLPPDASGAGLQALTLGRNLRALGWDVLLLAEGADGDSSPLLEGFRIERIAPLPRSPSRVQHLAYWLRASRALLRLRRDFDLLHLHNAQFDQAGAALVARLLGKPVLVRSSLAGEFTGLDQSRSGRLQKRIYRSVHAFIVLSSQLAQEYRESGLPAGRLNQIPNGVDTERFHPVGPERKAKLRAELGLPVTGKILVYHGVFIERKSLHWLVDLLEDKLALLDLTLLLVGGPAREEGETGYASHLMKQIRSSPARDRIIVRGHDPEVHRYLQAADAYILPSTSEGMANALLEAMATGLVTLVSRTSGSEDVVTDGVSGFLFEPRDASSFERCFERVFGPDGTTEFPAVSAAAVEQVQRHFSARAVAGRYIEIYDRLLRLKGPVAPPSGTVAPGVIQR